MFEITTNNIIFTSKSELSEINVNTIRNILGLLEEDCIESRREIIYMLSDVPIDILLSFKDEDIESVFSRINLNVPVYQDSAFKLKDSIYKTWNLDEMTLATYGELEYIMLNSENEAEQLHKILSILLKRVIDTRINILLYIKNKLIYKNIIPLKLKKYKYSTEEIDNSELFDTSLSADYGLSIYYNYILWRNKLIASYPDVWNILKTEDYTKEELEDIKKEPKGIFEKWGVYSQVWNISNSLQERDLWFTKNIRVFLKALSFFNIKTKEENKKLAQDGSK